MSDNASKDEAQPAKGGKKGLLIMIIVAILAVGGGAGGTWFFMQGQAKSGPDEEEFEEIDESKPAVFTDLDVFTVNLQPEENNQYLQVGLTVKSKESPVVEEITKQMPEIRNRILLLLSSKQATEISTMEGKQQLSEEITNQIKDSIDSKRMQSHVLGVLFSSFVIQ